MFLSSTGNTSIDPELKDQEAVPENQVIMLNFNEICTQLWAYFHSPQTPIDSKTFSNMPANDRVQLISRLIEEFNLLPSSSDKLDIVNQCKSSEKSAKLRVKADKIILTIPLQALVLYTRSIACAPDMSADLAEGYACRADLYRSLGNYEASLKDIDRASCLSRYEVCRRKSKCFKEMGNMKEALEHVLLALELLSQEETLTPEQVTVDTTCFIAMLEEIGEVPSDFCASPDTKTSRGSSKMVVNNPETNSLSIKVAIKHCTKLGRYVEATTDIQPGEILSVEKPFASVLLPHHYRTHCFHCLQQSDALIPCRHCDLAMFCSDECRTTAWDSSHKMECPLLPLLNDLNLGPNGIWHLALRIITSSSIKYGGYNGLRMYIESIEHQNQTRLSPNEVTNQRTKGFNESNQYESSDLRTVHFLERNTEKQMHFHLFKHAVKAACIMKCMKGNSSCYMDTGYYGDCTSFIGGLLSRYLMTLSCANASAILDLVVYKAASEDSPLEVDFGVGVYPVLSLFNHSCDANAISRFERGDVHVLVATRPIKCGEQITISYGPSYPSDETWEDRLYLLDEYFFICQCPPCVENWPTTNEVTFWNSPPNFLCWNCKAPLQISPDPALNTCTMCGKIHESVENLLRKFFKISQKCEQIREEFVLGGFDIRKIHDEMVKVVTYMNRMVARPDVRLHECEQLFKEVIMRQGNLFFH